MISVVVVDKITPELFNKRIVTEAMPGSFVFFIPFALLSLKTKFPMDEQLVAVETKTVVVTEIQPAAFFEVRL